MAIPLSGCGFTWPEWMILEDDPLAFIAGHEEESNTPPPPLVIPEDAPDQHAPQPSLPQLDASKNSDSQASQKPEIVPSSTMGLNLDTYFAQNIKDPETRMQRMENALVAIHNDLESLAQPMMAQTPMAEHPAAARTQQAATQAPEQIYPEDKVSPPTTETATTEEASAAPVPQNYAPPAEGKKVDPGSWLAGEPAGSQILATGIRVGEHADRVRVVFDLTKETKFSADLDNTENLLVVELPEAAWRAPPSAKFPKIALFDSYRVDPSNDGQGSIAVVQLKKGSTILKQQQIPALSGGGKRIYIDLAK